MTIQDLGSIGESVSAVTVLISLAYLAIQVRHASNSVSLNTDLQTRTAALDALSVTAASPENARVWHIGLRNIENLTPEEVTHFSQMLTMLFIVWEARYDHYLEGNLDESNWQRVERSIPSHLRFPGVVAYYDDNISYIHKPEFVELIDRIRKEGSA